MLRISYDMKGDKIYKKEIRYGKRKKFLPLGPVRYALL